MRYYIVDNMGNLWAESDNQKEIELLLENFPEDQAAEHELEIISDNEGENGMEYIVVDEPRNGSGDMFTKEFDNEEEAIAEAKDQWYHLTSEEKNKRKVYALKSVNPDVDAADHFNGDYIWHSDVKYYRDQDTGVIWSEEEIRENYELFKDEIEDEHASFEEFMEEKLLNGRVYGGYGYEEV